MVEIVVPVVVAAFLWWFSTGLVLMLDSLPRTTFRWSVAAATLLALGGLALAAATANDRSVGAAYLAFGAALLVWGWQELTFLTGWLTGPRRHPSVARHGSWRHFFDAIEAILWHELAIIAGGLLVAAIVWHGANHVALWTYGVLWAMRTSAKLNLFLGVRNLSEEMLPPHLTYLKSFFRRRRMNALFPLSVIGGTVVTVLLVQHALAPAATDAHRAGVLLVAALLALAVLEHWMMVLPVNATALWQWAMRLPPTAAPLPPGSAGTAPALAAGASTTLALPRRRGGETH